MEPEVKQEPTELQKLQQEYGKKVQIYGDMQYRVRCYQDDLAVLENELREINKKAAEHKQENAIELDEHGNPINKTVYYTMPQFLVNLNATGKSQVFLKTTVVLEVAKATDVPYIESNLPRLVDGINTYLRELRSSDLAGSAGIQRLREEILLRVNKAIAPMQVNDVLFKEIIVQ